MRLTGRGSDKQEAIEARLKMAIEEIQYALTGAHDFVVKNDDLDRAYEKFETVALGGETESDELPELPRNEDIPPPTTDSSSLAQSEQSTEGPPGRWPDSP